MPPRHIRIASLYPQEMLESGQERRYSPRERKKTRHTCSEQHQHHLKRRWSSIQAYTQTESYSCVVKRSIVAQQNNNTVISKAGEFAVHLSKLESQCRIDL